MTVGKGFLIIILSALAFALGGGLIGYTLAVAVPSYYRTVFRSGNEPWFDPREVGIGVGTTEGGMCGLAVGAVVVLAVAWYNSRRGSSDVGLTAAVREELQRRLAEHIANPEEIIPWEQIKAEASARFRK
jgi:putative addiction module component (TIGR02574 family)